VILFEFSYCIGIRLVVANLPYLIET